MVKVLPVFAVTVSGVRLLSWGRCRVREIEWKWKKCRSFTSSRKKGSEHLVSRAANLAVGRDEMCPQRYIFQHASGHTTIPRARIHDVSGSSCHRKYQCLMCLILSRVMEHQVCTYSSYELSLLLYRPMEPGVGYSTVTGKRHLPLKLDVLRRKGCTSQEEMIEPE